MLVLSLLPAWSYSQYHCRSCVAWESMAERSKAQKMARNQSKATSRAGKGDRAHDNGIKILDVVLATMSNVRRLVTTTRPIARSAQHPGQRQQQVTFVTGKALDVLVEDPDRAHELLTPLVAEPVMTWCPQCREFGDDHALSAHPQGYGLLCHVCGYQDEAANQPELSDGYVAQRRDAEGEVVTDDAAHKIKEYLESPQVGSGCRVLVAANSVRAWISN